MFDAVMEQIVSQILERMSKVESVKALPLVDNWSWLRILSIADRAKKGQFLEEPYGSTRQFLNFNHLMLLPAQLARIPLEKTEAVDVSVVLGPQAERPLQISTPIMITGMGYGVSVPLSFKRAMAKASAEAGTATNSGEGGFVQDERDLAHKYIVQFNKAYWGNSDDELAKADMVEIRVGQGAEPSSGYSMTPDQIGDDFREHLKLQPGQTADMPARFPDLKQPADFKQLVQKVREKSAGAPVAVKLAAGRLREDLEVAVNSGVDVIVLDGAQGGTSYSPQVTINNFGIPTVMAIPQAHQILQDLGVRDRISLVASAGMRDSGDFLKAVALGADAVYIGQAAIVAMSYHQWGKMPPGTSPAEMFRYGGQYSHEFEEEQGARDLANFIRASTTELEMALRSLGKRRLSDVDSSDLIALDSYTAEATGVQLVYKNE